MHICARRCSLESLIRFSICLILLFIFALFCSNILFLFFLCLFSAGGFSFTISILVCERSYGSSLFTSYVMSCTSLLKVTSPLFSLSCFTSAGNRGTCSFLFLSFKILFSESFSFCLVFLCSRFVFK